MTRALGLLSAGLLAVATACGGDIHDTHDTGDASQVVVDATGACNTLANSAETLSLPLVGQAPPAAQGGTIADGTYVMQSAAVYTGSGGASGATSTTTQVTIEVHAGTVQVVSTSGGTTTHLTVTIATSGTALTYTDTCPVSATLQGHYTASANALTVMLPSPSDAGAAILVEDFVRQ
jgi:hypothetical protein